MANTSPHIARQPSLFRQIAVRLAWVTMAFALLDVAIVVPMYALDQQALAEDFLEQQAHRIERTLEAAPSPSLAAVDLAALAPSPGVSDWGFVVIDANLYPVFRQNVAVGPMSSGWPGPSTLDWTRRDGTSGGTLVTGVRKYEGRHGRYWILIRADVNGSRAYWPVIGQELLEHVALPLVPLMALLLLFNVQIVRRTLAPLEHAAAEVDALDASRMEARLSPPADSREVAALVSAVNRALDRLQRAMALLKTFTADAAHELRTPLSVLRLRADALPDGPTKARLGEEIQAMTRLVNQMLDLAQADALRLDGAERIELNALAADVVSQIAPHAFASGHDLKLVDLGGAAIVGLPDALGRALRNLIENAIHHTPSGAIEIIVGPGPKWSVCDCGPGLPGTDPEKIFERFWRKARATDGGAGLGLGIVRSIVEAHGGQVVAQNGPSGGAIFTCTFPPPTAAGERLRS